MKISVIVLTLNEAMDLPDCLRSVTALGDLHVVDSGSSDATRDVAVAHGAKVYINPFGSFGRQRNWALDHCDVRSDWILFLDADERATPEFSLALTSALAQAAQKVAGFFCCWKMMLGARWLRRTDSFPKWQFRILRRGRARFCDFGHGQKEADVDGLIRYLHEPYLHYAFTRGWDYWKERHRSYAAKEAIEQLKARGSVRDVLSPHPSDRNKALKLALRRLPAWPLLRFLHMFVLKRGFMEGREAWDYCRHIFWFERLIRSNVREGGRSSG